MDALGQVDGRPADRGIGQTRRFRSFELTIEPKAPSRWPSISACMIAKNEANNIAPCLRSLEDLASEIIVVDTGSTDNTVEIAQSLGAKVYHFRWIDDFAAARNESLRHATKEWIFWLDADDRLTPKAVAQIKRAAASGLADAYSCVVSSRNPAGGHDATEHARLFRNGLGISFAGAIHETIWPDLLRLGLRLGRTDVCIDHVGYLSEETVRQKSARNLEIIQRLLLKEPGRSELFFYRGRNRLILGDLNGARDDIREYLERCEKDPTHGYYRFWAYLVLAKVCEQRGDLNGLRAALPDALAEFPDHPYFLFLKARLCMAEGDWQEACRGFRASLEEMGKKTDGYRPPETLVKLGVAQCYRALGKAEDALIWAEQAHQGAPDSEQAGTMLARLHIESGRLEEAARLLETLVAASESPEPWLALAELLHKQGRWEEASAAINEAGARGLQAETVDRLLSNLAASRVLASTRSGRTSVASNQPKLDGLAFLANGEPLRAAECLSAAIEKDPSDPDSYRYLAVALDRLGRREEAMQAWLLASRIKNGSSG